MINSFSVKISLQRMLTEKFYSTVVFLSMALGLAVSLFLYSQYHARAIKSLPFVDGESVIYASRHENGMTRLNGGLLNYDVHYIESKQNVLDHYSAIENRNITISTDSFTERLGGVATSSNFFKLTGVEPLAGRFFIESDDELGSPPVLVVSYDAWSRLFQKNEMAIGKTLQVNGVSTTLVGVAPKGFQFPLTSEAWISYVPPDLSTPDGEGWNAIVGKLKKGISVEQANDSFKKIVAELERDYPKMYAGKSIELQSFTHAFVQPTKLMVTIMGVVALSILAMSCFAIASLNIIRTLETAKENAIKSAIGVSRIKLMSESVTLSLILYILSTVAALGLLKLGVSLSANGLNSNGFFPFWWNVEFDTSLVITAITFSFVIWCITALLPIFLSVRAPSFKLISSGKKGGASNKGGLVMQSLLSFQIAFTFLLMLFSSVAAFSLYKVVSADYGVETSGFFIAEAHPNHPELADRLDYYDRLQDKVGRLPSVEGVSITATMPGFYSYLSSFNSTDIDLSTNGAFPKANEIPIDTNYFDVMGIPLLRGRNFVKADNVDSEQVVIISDQLEKRISPDGSALGKKLHLNPDRNGPLLTVVGVVPELPYGPPVSLYEAKYENIYRPNRQVMPAWMSMTILIKVSGNPYDVEPSLRQAAREVDPDIALSNVMSYEDNLLLNGSEFKSLTYNFAPAALLAFLMAVLSVYVVSARTVFQNTNDIGVMRAVGLRKGVINNIYLRKAYLNLVLGLIGGAVMFFVFVPGIISKMVVVDTTAIILIGLALSVLISSVVVISSYLPLRRAHALSPVDAINS